MSDDHFPPSPPSPWEVAGETAAAVVELGAPAAELTPEAEARILIYGRITAERRRQEEKFTGGSTCADPTMDPALKVSVLTEELGEVAREVNDARHENREPDVAALMEELIQVAAVAVAWIESYITRPPRGGE